MIPRAMFALVRNDIRLYLVDRRAVLIGVVVPVAIAAFFGYVFGAAGGGADTETGRVPIAVVDEDQSTVTRAIVSDLAADAMLDVATLSREEARVQVQSGARHVAAIFPADFGRASVSALFNGSDKPTVELLVDPSQSISARLVQGLLAQYSMQDISREAFSGALGRAAVDDALADLDQQADTASRRELRTLLAAVKRLSQQQAEEQAEARAQGMPQPGGAGAGTGADAPLFQLDIPYELSAQQMTAGKGVPYNGYAHSFAGMAVQFILFAGIDAGILLLLLRERGIWQRIRSAPVSRAEFVLSRMLATALISVFQLSAIYLAAMAIFGVRIEGSVAGFIVVGASFCILNAAFGLMLAAVGNSAGTTRGIATMATLLLVMLGGAWVPAFVFPRWLQQLALFTPTRWAVDGLDAVTWRGLGFDAVVLPTLVLLCTAAVCFTLALWRFRWEQ